jgi:hypothetical protein
MKHPMGKTKLALCRHEAAHAIVAERFGNRVLWVRAGEHGKSHTQIGRVKSGPVAYFCVLMAGSVAEWLWHGTPKGAVSAGDGDALNAMGVHGEDFRILWEETARLVRKLKPKIWKLAEQLEGGKRVKR